MSRGIILDRSSIFYLTMHKRSRILGQYE